MPDITKMNSKFLILGGSQQYYKPFLRHGVVTSDLGRIDDIDCLVFTGGSDISPRMYGEVASDRIGHTDYVRDTREMGYYLHAVKNGIPMVGICRGAQFLNVMNGGKLVQDINNHAIKDTHNIRINKDSKFSYKQFYVNSTHHQMMIPDIHRSHELLGWTEGLIGSMHGVPVEFSDYKDKYSVPSQEGYLSFKEPEVLWYEPTLSMCIQYHPETMGESTSGALYFDHLIEEYIK